MADWSGFGTNFADNFSRGMAQVQQQQKQAQLFDYLLQHGSQMQVPNPDDPTKTHPLFDTKAVEAMTRMNQQKKAALAGQLQGQVESAQHVQDAWARMQLANQLEHKQDVPVTVGDKTFNVSQPAALTAARAEQTTAEEAPQRAAQLEATKTSTARTKQIMEQEGKINVPGFGMMTAPQYSAHVNRQERLAVLQKKSEPILNFENQLQNAYGLGIQDIVDASKPRKFTGGDKTEYTGTPFFNTTGQQISGEDANKDPEGAFVLAGANKIPIPLVDKKGGLGWQQIIGKAANFSGKLDALQTQQTQLQQQNTQVQAQQTLALLKDKDPAQMTPDEQKAWATAKRVLGQ